MTALHPLLPRTPFENLPDKSGAGRGVLVSERTTLGLATVLARRGRRTALAERMRERFGIELPEGPHRTSVADLALLGTGPGAWLATRERQGKDFATSIAEAVADLASVSEQSDGYAVLRLSGPKVREALAKMVPIDLHPGAFGCGAVAVTSAGHVGSTLWRLPDTDGGSVFEIAVPRSLATDFWHFLAESAAEFGFAHGSSST